MDNVRVLLLGVALASASQATVALAEIKFKTQKIVEQGISERPVAPAADVSSGDTSPKTVPAWAEDAKMNPDYTGPSAAEQPVEAAQDAAPASTGGEGVTQYYGVSENAGTPAWAAEAVMNADYAPAAATAPAEASAPSADATPAPAGDPGVTQYFGVGTANAAPAWAAEAAMNPDYTAAAVTAPASEELPPAPAGEPGVTQFYGSSAPSGTPAWAAEAAMNADYAASPASAPAVGQGLIENCRDALNAEATAGKLVFKSSSWSISPSNYKTLDDIAGIAKDCGAVVIEIGGHTDNTGKTGSNKTISELRAAAIVSYLAKAGVDANKLKAVGYGEDRPVASNDTPAGRQANRRIEFLVTAP